MPKAYAETPGASIGLHAYLKKHNDVIDEIADIVDLLEKQTETLIITQTLLQSLNERVSTLKRLREL